ncbi:serine/threonine-protein phosphatase 7 long form homolog [Prosopis cineraria]|uniref:serine/threonine-protein phosphatase 7 long form homolog n=1 Tax=Prosopis cineraria TaxID=364024 RepID=UPI0024101047|nr:serine/threonine-protein phosphatase 7 long form homolog [Prosopis cineraria]
MEMEVRGAGLMVSPLGGKQNLRMAHFLKPACIQHPESDHLPKTLFSEAAISLSQTLSSQTRFTGWLTPQEQWNTWEENLRSKYENVWRNAGILEAIKASTYRIPRSHDLVLGLAQKWYPETNSFIFAWGEATITLDDVMICGGHSVVESYVFTPLKDKESKLMEQRLDEVRRKLIKTKAKKATHVSWLRHFMEEEEEGELEHVAFLSLWLSRFVFPPIISKQNFSIALHLARGTRIALAPVVLASIYRDLTLLKGKFDEAIKSEAYKRDHECGLSAKSIILRAPFQLVQIWAFERFPAFHLKSNIIEYAQPLTAKWHKVKMLNYGDVSLALDSSAKSFLWQPYKDSPKLYNEKDRWVCFNNSDSHEDLESFARCLRHSQLVGIDCIEMYLPHRVAMQFALDQDIPEKVARCKENNPEIAWRNYDSPMTEAMLCIAAVAASSTLEPSVTYKYLEWWKQSKLGASEQHGLISKPIKFSEKLSQISPEMGSSLHRDQTGNNSDQDHGSAIEKLQKRSQSRN